MPAPESTQVLFAFANLGGMGLFSWVVYTKLRDMATSFKLLSDAIIKMEERGHRLARPTPGAPRTTPYEGTPVYRPPTE